MRAFALGAALLLSACAQDDGSAPPDPAMVARGAPLYMTHCASCHGTRLEGEPDWRIRNRDGRLPAPPHDASGHTWHHPDAQLLAITRDGLVPPHAPPGYRSNMPAFRGVLTDDEIRAVLAYIRSHWPPEVLAARAEMLRGRSR